MKSGKAMTAAAFMTFLLVLFLFFFPVKTGLVFYGAEEDELVAYLPIGAGGQFDLIFTHSIHRSDVIEKYTVTPDLAIEQYEIIYEEFGIGMPSNAGEGETFVNEDGVYHIKGLDNSFVEIKLRNGKTVSENRIAWDISGERREAWLNEYFEPGAILTLKAEKLTPLDMLKGVEIGE